MHEHHWQTDGERRVLAGHERAYGEAQGGAARGAEREQADQCTVINPQPAAPLEQQAEGGGEARVERQLGDQLGEQVLAASVLAARSLAVDHMPG